jgi:hypothetical protein
MLAFPSMLFPACKEAGISYPENADENIVREDYPHFHTFCALQLGKRMTAGSQFINAKIVACFTEEQIKLAFYSHFYLAGFDFCGELNESDFKPEELEQSKKDLIEWDVTGKVEVIKQVCIGDLVGDSHGH